MSGSNAFGEIIASLRKNKLRTLLTGLSIAWGIFMLIVLLGMGNGVRNTIEKEMSSMAGNTVTVRRGWTSMPYEGLPQWRMILLNDAGLEFIRSHYPEVGYITANTSVSVTLAADNEYVAASLESATPDLQRISRVDIKQGRFINEMDQRMMRKVIVLHPNHVKVLFKDEDPIGKTVFAGSLPYQVVGVYQPEYQYGSEATAYVPLSVAQMLFEDAWWGYHSYQFTVDGIDTPAENDAFLKRLRAGLGRVLKFDANDTSAIHINSTIENAEMTRKAFRVINLLLIIIGLASMVAGIVGVGNIMYVTVRERTREIGIRKAIGASPASIIRLVILESIFITTVAGYAGILAGMLSLKLAGVLMSDATVDGVAILTNPSVDWGIIIGATLLLIACGVGAGFVPAWRATKIKPVEAMKAE